jgi:glycerol-3-phosphate dehydrogenase
VAELDGMAESLAAEWGLAAGTAGRLVRAYGSEARDVLERGAEPVATDAGLVTGEIDHAVDEEGALHLEDLLYRRTGTALYDPEGRTAAPEPAARRMAERLGWDEAQRDREVARMRKRLTADLAFAQEAGEPFEQGSKPQKARA